MIDRRTLLLSLAAIPPVLTWPQLAAAQASEQFATVSRIITGSDSLTPGATARIEALLADRDANFAGKLASLHQALSGAASREAGLAALSDADLDTALVIAKPWYLGYVGDPSGRILQDDAAFATFLAGAKLSARTRRLVAGRP